MNDDSAPALDGLTGWCLTTGSAGHEVQCMGVLEALGIEPAVKRIAPPRLYRWMAPWGPAAPDRELAPSWPDILVVSGRQAIPYARMVKRRSGGRTFVVVLQSPGVSPSAFDLVWVPEHDRLRGPNVIATLTSPHRLSKERLAAEAERFAGQVAHLPRPLVCVLVGGASDAYRFHRGEAETLADDLAAFARNTGCGLMVTPSRRTGAGKVSVLRERLADVPAVVWDLGGDNPYFGFMGLAEAFVVTCDSVNMLGEAAFTGRPLYAYPLPGGEEKFTRYHAALAEAGILRWFDGSLDRWTYPPLDATSYIADEVRRRIAEHRRQFQIRS